MDDLVFRRSLPERTVYLSKDGYTDLGLPTAERTCSTSIGGANVNVTIEVPDEILNPYPVVIAHGYCGSKHAYDALRNALARNGTVAVSYDSPRIQKIAAALHPTHINKPAQLLSQAIWGATRRSMQMADELDLPIHNRYDVIAHSMGGRSATLAAHHRPQFFRSVLLNGAAGLEPQTLPMMVGRLPRFSHELRGTDPSIILGSMSYIARNPVKTAAEGIAVARADIRQKVRELGKLGVSTAIVVGRDDFLIPAERVAKGSGVGVADLFAVYGDQDAGHLYLQKKPLQAAMAQLQMLQLLHGSGIVEQHNTAA